MRTVTACQLLHRAEHPPRTPLTAGCCLPWAISYVLVQGLRDELSLAVDAGVGALAGDLLLLLGDAARGRGRPARVQGA